MATKEQFEFFRSLLDEEDQRYEQLESRAKFYMGLVTIFMAALFLKAHEVAQSTQLLSIPWWLVLFEALALSVTLFFVTLAVLIRNYEGICDPEDLIDSLGSQPPTNEEFFDDRIADYVVATKRNSETNDKVARRLLIAGFSMAFAVFLVVVMFVIALVPKSGA